jgi:hypothetical protein
MLMAPVALLSSRPSCSTSSSVLGGGGGQGRQQQQQQQRDRTEHRMRRQANRCTATAPAEVGSEEYVALSSQPASVVRATPRCIVIKTPDPCFTALAQGHTAQHVELTRPAWQHSKPTLNIVQSSTQRVPCFTRSQRKRMLHEDAMLHSPSIAVLHDKPRLRLARWRPLHNATTSRARDAAATAATVELPGRQPAQLLLLLRLLRRRLLAAMRLMISGRWLQLQGRPQHELPLLAVAAAAAPEPHRLRVCYCRYNINVRSYTNPCCWCCSCCCC